MMIEALIKNLNFINISSDEMILVEWRPPESRRTSLLDLNLIREDNTDDIFFNVDKLNTKMAYIRKNNIYYAIGAEADEKVQFQLMESLLEIVIKQFQDTYDTEVIFSVGNVSPNAFMGFKSILDEIFANIKTYDLGKTIHAHCRACNKSRMPIFIKKSIIDNAESYPVPIVYNHKGHALLCYIDKNFEVRGVEIVNTTG